MAFMCFSIRVQRMILLLCVWFSLASYVCLVTFFMVQSANIASFLYHAMRLNYPEIQQMLFLTNFIFRDVFVSIIRLFSILVSNLNLSVYRK